MIGDFVGYYPRPTVWAGSEVDASIPAFNPTLLCDEVAERELTCGIRVKLFLDGLFLFDLSSIKRKSPLGQLICDKKTGDANRLALLNAHLIFLHTALHRQQKIKLDFNPNAPASLLQFEDFSLSGAPSFGGDPAINLLYLARYATSYHAGLPYVFDWRLSGRLTVLTAETITASFDALDQFIEKSPGHIFGLTTLLAQALRAYRDHDFTRSLLLTSDLVERMVCTISETKEREASLESVLAAAGQQLGGRVVARVEELLEARRRFLRLGEMVDEEVSGEGLRTAQKLFRQATGCDCKLPLSLKPDIPVARFDSAFLPSREK